MASGDTRYSTQFDLPEFIVKNRAQVIVCPIYLNGELVAPTSGTVSIYNSSNQAVVEDAAVTITSSIATYSIASDTFDDQTLADAWKVKWTLTLSGKVCVFERWAALIRNEIYCPISDRDLTRLLGSLDPNSSRKSVKSDTTYQAQIEEAWLMICNEMINERSKPYLTCDVSALAEPTRYLALHLICTDFSIMNPNDTVMQEKAKQYWDLYRLSYETRKLKWDETNTGNYPKAGIRATKRKRWLC